MLLKIFSISIFISIVFFILFSRPVLASISEFGFVGGLPAIYLYIIAVWVALIALLMWITSKKQYTEK